MISDADVHLSMSSILRRLWNEVQMWERRKCDY